MSERIQPFDSEFRCKTRGQITVIFDPHASGADMRAGLPMWGPRVDEAVAEIKPWVIAPDSLRSGFFLSNRRQMIPVWNLSRMNPELHVISADVTTLGPTSPNPMINQENWTAITDATIEYDPDFSPITDRSNLAGEYHRLYAIEETALSAGLLALTARIFCRVNETRKRNPQPHPFTRRDFLKLMLGLAGGAAVAAINYGREPAFFAGMMETQVTDGTPNLLQTIVRATKPILGADKWADMRDAKLGEAVISKLRKPDGFGKTAVIIFGNGHLTDAYPGQWSWETMEQTLERLLSISRLGFEKIIENNQNGQDRVPSEIMEAALLEIFARSDEYFPMPPRTGQRQSEIYWELRTSGLIPEVAALINEVINDKYNLL